MRGWSRSGQGATGGACWATTPKDSGVTVLSKWPILREEQYIHKDSCDSHRWPNKGFDHAELNVGPFDGDGRAGDRAGLRGGGEAAQMRTGTGTGTPTAPPPRAPRSAAPPLPRQHRDTPH
ncbi:hypothetical protein GCM10015535_01160 [Streptomyces gelaticus]|uniref:Uncharacterized protein n=1 Tax=Streptomyces gelaticus TaxID=285446 RepID=A0ABQ2VQ11_9ACTN|nr:hypothetical protein GCM10015535_01160 [Streptomyces gelaticus]